MFLKKHASVVDQNFNLKRIFFKDSLIYGFTKYLGIVSAIILTPFYTRILSKEDYGVMDFFITWNTFAGMIIPLGITSAIIRLYQDVKDDPKEKRKYLGSIVTMLLSSAIIYILILLFFQNRILINLFQNLDYQNIFTLSIFIVVVNIINDLSFSLLQVKFKKIQYLSMSLVSFFILSVGGFYFVLIQKTGIIGFFYASAFSSICTCFTGIAFNYKDLSINFNFTAAKKILGYSIHFVSVFLLFQFTILLDRYLINHYIGLEGVGVYSIAIRISGVISILISSFSLAWFPYAMSIKDEPFSNDIYIKAHKIYFMGLTCLIIPILVFRQELINLFAPTYSETFGLLGVLMALNLINGSVYFYCLGIHIKQKTKVFTLNALVSILINIVSSIILVKSLGLAGIVWGSFWGSVYWIVSNFYYSNKLHPIKFSNFHPAICLLIILLLNYLLFPFENHITNTTTSFVLKILFTFLLLLYVIYILKRSIKMASESKLQFSASNPTS